MASVWFCALLLFRLSLLVLCSLLGDLVAQEYNVSTTNLLRQNSAKKKPSAIRSQPTLSPPLSVPPRNLVLAARIPGDLILGGLFPVHKKGPVACGEIQPDRGVQRVEAMLFTIDHINRNKDVLPDVTLGAYILDTCSRETYALDQALEYVRASLNLFDVYQFRCENGSLPTVVNPPENVVGVVGGSYSSVSIQVANLLRLFKIPQVSYASTSVALSDKTRFEFFARTVPPDNFQAKAMADIALHFNWTYVNTVASEGDYGEMGIDSFRMEARARNICIAVSEKVSQNADEDRYDEIIRRLQTKTSARVVVLFLRVEDARDILLAARRQNVSGHFVWVASDGWGKEDMPVRGNDFAAQGALTLELQSSHIPEFDVYFRGLHPLRNHRNMWFKEYWEHVHDCIFHDDEDDDDDDDSQLSPEPPHSPPQRGRNGTRSNPSSSSSSSGASKRICSGTEALSSRHYTQESKMQFVFDAVYALAHALDHMINAACGRARGGKRSRVKCIRSMKIDGEELYKNYLLNLTFDDGYGATVKFDKYGDGIGRYNIMNYRRNRTTGKYEYVTIGRWNNGLFMDSTQTVTWTGGTYDLPVSQCSRPCQHGQIKQVPQGDVCCWVCTSCDPSDVVEDEFTCRPCPSGWWPSADKQRCVELEMQYMQWTSTYALIPAALSGLGIFCTCVVVVVFVRNFDSPVVRASGRELSFMLFAGFLICYLLTFVLLAKPGPVVCGVQRFGVGFGFSVTYSALLTKTNRISRIFDSARYSAKRPPFISPRSQVVITLLLISVQAVGAAVWLVLEPPYVRLYHPFDKRDEIVLKCGLGDQWFMMSLVYNVLLIVVCTMYAVKTRKIPENFNESKYIGFTMYTTCIIWLAFIPIYFGTLNTFQVQITTLCVSISLSATVALICLFVPKLHIILFQADKNVRKLTMKTSATYKRSTSANSVSNQGRSGGGGGSSAQPRFSTLTDLDRSEVQLEQVNCQSTLGGSSPAAPATDSALADDDCSQMDECMMDMRELQHPQQQPQPLHYGTNVTSL